MINYKSKMDVSDICKATGYPFNRFIAWQEKIKTAEEKGFKAEALLRQKKLEKKQAIAIQNEYRKTRNAAVKDLYKISKIDIRKQVSSRETILLLVKEHGEFKIKRNLFLEDFKQIFDSIKNDKILAKTFFEKLALKGVSKQNYVNLTTLICKNKEAEYEEEKEIIAKMFNKTIGVSSSKAFEDAVMEAILYDYLFKEVERNFTLYHLHVFPEIFIILSSFSQAKKDSQKK